MFKLISIFASLVSVAFSLTEEAYQPLKVVNECPPLNPRSRPPTSVRDLRPDDVKVIGALGDSITAGFAATGLKDPSRPIDISSIFEQRGVSWSIGGDAGAITMANYFKNYNPNIVGASIGEHIANLCYGIICPPFQYKPELDRFNAARSGALASNLMGEVKWLSRQMAHSREINFKNDFKYITLFIGSNDACISCVAGNSFLSPDNFERTMREVVAEVQRRIPKVILNIHQQFNVSQVWDLTKDIPYCKKIRALGLKLECACAFQDNALGAKNRVTMDTLTQEYNRRLLKIRDDYSKKVDDSFMLIVDPLFRDASIDDFPQSYISNVDCFHPGIKAHQLIGTAAWNNLFLPFEKKLRFVPPQVQLTCPTDDDRIRP